MITEENVLKVASLAELEISELETKKYTKELSDILTEIEKILDAKIENENILIAPTEEKKIDDLESTINEESLSKEEIMKNAKNHDRSYIIVKRVVNE